MTVTLDALDIRVPTRMLLGRVRRLAPCVLGERQTTSAAILAVTTFLQNKRYTSAQVVRDLRSSFNMFSYQNRCSESECMHHARPPDGGQTPQESVLMPLRLGRPRSLHQTPLTHLPCLHVHISWMSLFAVLLGQPTKDGSMLSSQNCLTHPPRTIRGDTQVTCATSPSLPSSPSRTFPRSSSCRTYPHNPRSRSERRGDP